MKDKNRWALFEPPLWWEEYWQGMPEFIQEDQTSIKTIIIHFATKEDIAMLADLIEQPITLKTQSLWFPEAEIGRIANKRYIDR